MFTSIAGRSVIVTGGSKGIGKGIASVFAKAGANVLIVGRDQGGLDTAARSLSGLGGSVSTHQVEISDRVACDDMARVAVRHQPGAPGLHHRHRL